MANPSRTAAPGRRTVGWLMLAGAAAMAPRTAVADDAALRSQGEYQSARYRSAAVSVAGALKDRRGAARC